MVSTTSEISAVPEASTTTQLSSEIFTRTKASNTAETSEVPTATETSTTTEMSTSEVSTIITTEMSATSELLYTIETTIKPKVSTVTEAPTDSVTSANRHKRIKQYHSTNY